MGGNLSSCVTCQGQDKARVSHFHHALRILVCPVVWGSAALCLILGVKTDIRLFETDTSHSSCMRRRVLGS